MNATSRLVKIGTLFLRETNIVPVLGEIVEAAISVSGADFGNIQLLDEASGDLEIVRFGT